MDYVVTVSAQMDINVEADSMQEAREKAVGAVKWGSLTQDFACLAEDEYCEEGYDPSAESV